MRKMTGFYLGLIAAMIGSWSVGYIVGAHSCGGVRLIPAIESTFSGLWARQSLD